MGRKSKFSLEQKLAILKETEEKNISQIINKYSISYKTIHRWQLLYRYQGIDGLNCKSNNKVYSREFKLSLIAAFKKSTDSSLEFSIKHGLKSDTQLIELIKQYNEFSLKANRPRKRDSIMTKKRKTARKTNFEERLKIIEDLIKHDINYNWAATKYNVSYAQVYRWYQKYINSGKNSEALRDNRGKSKPKENLTELDRLKAENRLLKAQLQQQEMEVAFAKKLIEIRNRGGERK